MIEIVEKEPCDEDEHDRTVVEQYNHTLSLHQAISPVQHYSSMEPHYKKDGESTEIVDIVEEIFFLHRLSHNVWTTVPGTDVQ
jgi:hypothetical protein